MPAPDRIVQAAARLFLELGFDGVTTEAVAAASGVTKAMVYYYYGSKTNLFTAAIEWMMDVSRQQTQEILSRPVPLRDRLQIIALTRLRITAPLDLDAMMRGSRQVLTEEQLARIRHAEEQMVSVIAQAFQAGVAAGEVREIDAQLAARVFLAMLMVGKAELNEGRLTADRLEDRCREWLSIFWSGVAAPASAPAAPVKHSDREG